VEFPIAAPSMDPSSDGLYVGIGSSGVKVSVLVPSGFPSSIPTAIRFSTAMSTPGAAIASVPFADDFKMQLFPTASKYATP
jgi:hypothetical protein